MIRQIGATYLIITLNKPFLLKASPLRVTSSVIAFGLITQPIRIQVKNATIGIRILLLKKSKNVRISIPKILKSDQIPFPSDDGIPINKQSPITIRQPTHLFTWNLSISEETIASIIEMALVIAAKNTRIKNNRATTSPPGIWSNTFGRVINIRPGPLLKDLPHR